MSDWHKDQEVGERTLQMWEKEERELRDLRSQIAAVTRERDEARKFLVDLKARCHEVENERDEARSALKELEDFMLQAPADYTEALARISRLRAVANLSRTVAAKLRDRDRNTHRGLQWAYNLAIAIDAALAALEPGDLEDGT